MKMKKIASKWQWESLERVNSPQNGLGSFEKD